MEIETRMGRLALPEAPARRATGAIAGRRGAEVTGEGTVRPVHLVQVVREDRAKAIPATKATKATKAIPATSAVEGRAASPAIEGRPASEGRPAIEAIVALKGRPASLPHRQAQRSG